MQMRIPYSEIKFSPSSIIDPVGRVFWWKGEVFRAIQFEYEDFYRELFEIRNIESLFNQGLIYSELTPYMLDGYGLIIKHKRISFSSYCMEWCFDMLRDAALKVCDLSIELLKKGLVFKDAHPWNLLFENGEAVFIDWGSIGPLNQQNEWPYLEFRGRFIFYLYLISTGQSRLARTLMSDVTYCPSREDIFRLLLNKVNAWNWLDYWITDKKNLKNHSGISPIFFHNLRKSINKITCTFVPTEWSNYQGPETRFSHNSSDEWTVRIKNISNLLQSLKPKTVLDIGCNKGWFAELAALQGAKVVAIDIDEFSINNLYCRVRKNKLPILPLVIDIRMLTPTHGFNSSYSGPIERLSAELVLALAITHHLVFKNGLRFEFIINQFAKFTIKWLIIEFIPGDDQYVKDWMKESYSWYSLENFLKELNKCFKHIDIFESFPAPRLLLLCEK